VRSQGLTPQTKVQAERAPGGQGASPPEEEDRLASRAPLVSDPFDSPIQAVESLTQRTYQGEGDSNEAGPGVRGFPLAAEDM
jgi:hypothetical protein